LHSRIARCHADVDSAFWGWNDIWLDPAFRDCNIEDCIASITCPILAVQGEDDEYGTLEQIRGIKKSAACKAAGTAAMRTFAPSGSA
jgi:predicted alpha/beta hydrolase